MTSTRMPARSDPCVICGATPTVSSHIIPRAIVHDIRGADPYVHETEAKRRGSKFTQSGEAYYGLLCAEHEDGLKRFDDYGVRMVRSLNKLFQGMREGQKGSAAKNPKPDAFKGFTLACIWRAVKSYHGRKFNLSLGKYEEPIRLHLFEGEPISAPIFASRSRLVLPDSADRTPLVMPPLSNQDEAVELLAHDTGPSIDLHNHRRAAGFPCFGTRQARFADRAHCQQFGPAPS